MKEYNANLPQVFNYMGNEITFLNGESVMINATEMARVFGKEVRQWFANAETHEFIHALADHKGLQPQELPKGGKLTSLNTSTLANAYPSLIMVVKGGIP
jgi:hypothetical protein